MENQESRAEIILGVDTHLDVHVGVVIDAAGRALGTLSVGTHNGEYKQLLCWARTFGLLRRAGVEGTGSYGAALTLVLQTMVSKSLRSTDQIVLADAGAVKVTLPMQNAQPGPSWQAMLCPFPRYTTVQQRRCVR